MLETSLLTEIYKPREPLGESEKRVKKGKA